MLDLNLFNNRNISNELTNKNNDFINTFIEELKNALKNIMNEGIGMNQKKNISNEPNSNEKNDVMEEYNLYETRKIFLDNKSWKGNDFAWVMDDGKVNIKLIKKLKIKLMKKLNIDSVKYQTKILIFHFYFYNFKKASSFICSSL